MLRLHILIGVVSAAAACTAEIAGVGGADINLPSPDGPVDEGDDSGDDSGDVEDNSVVVPCAAPLPTAVSVLEGDSVELDVVCSTGAPVIDADFVWHALPPDAQWDAERRHLSWQTDLDDAAVVQVQLEIAATGEVYDIAFEVADALGAPNNQPIAQPLYYTRELGLPVVFVSTRPTTESYVPTVVTVEGLQVDGEIKLRGAFSLTYPKKSFTVKTNGKVPLPWLGDAPRDKFVLTSTFDDNSYVRQHLVYQLWNALSARGAEHAAIATAPVVVYVDGAYEGLYTLGDHVNRDLFGDTLDIADEGNLYKAVNHEANLRPTMQNGGSKNGNLAMGYELRDEVLAPTNLWSDLTDLITFIDAASEAELVAQLDARIDVDDVIDWWAIVSAVDGADSAGKNSYLFFSAEEQRFRAVPWDFNHSFGQAWESSRTASDGDLNYYNHTMNGLFARLYDSPSFGPQMRARMATALRGPMSVDAVLQRFAVAVDKVRAAALRDQSVWGAQYIDFYTARTNREDLNDFESEVLYTRAWIEARWAYLATIYP